MPAAVGLRNGSLWQARIKTEGPSVKQSMQAMEKVMSGAARAAPPPSQALRLQLPSQVPSFLHGAVPVTPAHPYRHPPLMHPPTHHIHAGCIVASCSAFVLLLLEQRGARWLEALFGVVIAVEAVLMAVNFSRAGVSAKEVALGECQTGAGRFKWVLASSLMVKRHLLLGMLCPWHTLPPSRR